MEIVLPILTLLSVLLPKIFQAIDRRQQTTSETAPQREKERRDALLATADPTALSVELERLRTERAARDRAAGQSPTPPRV